jgi:uncharacterized protein YndB with AHSA1/START domain
MTDTTAQMYQIVIKADPERIWAAITTPEWTQRYFHRARITVTPERYVSYGPDGDTWGNGEVYEWDPPRRLSHEWRSLYDEVLGAEEPSRVTWDIEPIGDGEYRLTLTHDRLEGAPRTADSVRGRGWMTVTGGLKQVLETADAPV